MLMRLLRTVVLIIFSVRCSSCAICSVIVALILILGVFMLIIIVLSFSLLNQFSRWYLRWRIKYWVVDFCLSGRCKSLHWFLMCFHWHHWLLSLTLRCVWITPILFWIVEILGISRLKVWFFLWTLDFMRVYWYFSVIIFAGKIVCRIRMSHIYLYFNNLIDFNIYI